MDKKIDNKIKKDKFESGLIWKRKPEENAKVNNEKI